ncbi:GNAT family N-acetyltransferase [Agrobacterium vitis]|uniref:GNAT family N-acetyltransferase n=1 Tax=Agrobacterium vitis TaxID=373 RepID=A0ABD6G8W6_AGRVI|nr:GNAT family N-acetyltransferase [Agrobacterium vitis]MUO79322.1 GNAT family N-acetyltransferase [Agrobacterium vitis]MUO96147.1 GNAT family N-acetyltransferase [Agrobacterium vitis]MUP05788.1 GNAT family N-acetyltransferase [Agrobacterium vitis]MUZ82872.1 GNAT family N-acetyltransferase [Agrobacterium vitis]MVA11753.1 GNAT family N-acetyltransferase [Agrobacterium vitis]
MHPAPTLTLAPLAREDCARVLHLALPPAQQVFAGSIAEAVEDADPAVDFHIGSVCEEPVCFFKIDRGYDTRLAGFDLAEHGFQPGDLGLRALIVGSQFQGKGFGKAAMVALPAYLARHYPARHCFLTVNLRNPTAIGLYTKSGWQNTGQTYLGGKAGPQVLMRLDL